MNKLFLRIQCGSSVFLCTF